MNPPKEPTEIITPTAVKQLVKINKETCEKMHRPFGVNRVLLGEVVRAINAYSDIVDSRSRIAKKASNILSGIIVKKPFDDGNFETAFTFMLAFIEDAGFELAESRVEQLFQKIERMLADKKEIGLAAERYLLENMEQL